MTDHKGRKVLKDHKRMWPDVDLCVVQMTAEKGWSVDVVNRIINYPGELEKFLHTLDIEATEVVEPDIMDGEVTECTRGCNEV